MQALALLAQFILLILAQKFLFGNFTLFDIAYVNVAILFPVFFPFSIQKTLGIAIVFAFGITLDFVVGTPGLNASSMLAVYYLREVWVSIITPMARIEPGDSLDLRAEIESFNWMTSYMVPLVFLYYILYFILADFGISGFLFLKVLASGVYTSLICVLMAILLFRTGRRR